MYDRQRKAPLYNSAYEKVLEARRGNRCLVDQSGNVDERSLEAIECALKAFDMGRQMDERFADKLKSKLSRIEIKRTLRKFRDFTICSQTIAELKTDVQDLYGALSAAGDDGLSADPQHRFSVGATKIMNFLFPELSVIVDSNVQKAINCYIPDFDKWTLDSDRYWQVMMICAKELGEWKEQRGGLDRLLKLDSKPTTLTRIFDKCAFIIGKCGMPAMYRK